MENKTSTHTLNSIYAIYVTCLCTDGHAHENFNQMTKQYFPLNHYTDGYFYIVEIEMYIMCVKFPVITENSTDNHMD